MRHCFFYNYKATNISSKLLTNCDYVLKTNAIQIQPCMEQLLCIHLKLKTDVCLHTNAHIWSDVYSCILTAKTDQLCVKALTN